MKYTTLLFCCAFVCHAFGQSPGGVPTTNLALWLKADANTSCSTGGCSITLWNDAGPGANTGTGFNGPAFSASAHNFNPGITFNGSNQYFDVTDGFADFTAGVSAFVVAAPSTSTAWSRFFDLGNGAANNNLVLNRNASTADLYYSAYNGATYSGLITNTGPIENGRDHLYGAGQSGTGSSAAVFKDGKSIFTGTVGTLANVTRTLNYIGRSNWADPYYAGDMSEIVLFKTDLNATDRQKVNSYLCAKYGLTLDQSTAQSYLASDGTTKMWDHTATNAATYNKNITVIGRDDASALNQKQSKSANTEAMVAVGNGNSVAGSNAANPSTFTADRAFLSFGDNNGALTWSATGAPGGRAIIARKWLVQEYGPVASVKLTVPDNSSTSTTKLPLESTNVYLLTDADGDFSSGATETLMTLNTSSLNWVGNANLTNGQYFTFATENITPGGVPLDNLALWLKADVGTSCTTGGCALTAWNDASLMGNVGAAFNSPTLSLGTHNFNPGITFNGTNAYFDVTDGFADFTGGLNAFVVASPTSSPNNARFLDFGNGQANNNIVLHRNGTTANLKYTVYNAAATSGVISTSSPIANGTDQLYAARQAAASGNAWLLKNGASIFSGTGVNIAPNITRTLNYIGRSNWAGDPYYAGDMSEIVLFKTDLSATDRQKVDSYLCAKYGLTLDQGTAQSYLASDGTTKMWDHTATNAATYNQNITVIGRDDASALMQKQSKSVATAALVTVGHGNTIATTNAGNSNSFSPDKSFMSFGDNNGALTWTTTGGTATRMVLGRVWLVQEYGTVGSVKVQVPDNSSSLAAELPTEQTTVYLLTDADGNFSAGATETAMTLNGTNWEASADLINGQYFTFATERPAAPGGVVSNLQVWLRADLTTPNVAGNLTDWQNSASTAFDLVHTSSDPARVEAAANFNPAVVFDGDDGFTTDPASGTLNYTSTFTSGEVFSMVKAATATQVLGSPYDFGGESYSLYTDSDGALYSDFGSTVQKGWYPVTLAVAAGGGTTQAPAVDVLKYQLFNTYSATNDWASAFNGRTAYSTSSNTVSFLPAAGGNHIGATSSIGWQGNMPEVCLYDRKLSATERAQVNSYFAAKYGTTLDQTVAQSYIASDGTTKMWDHTATNAATYNKNITVIGRDDASALMQKQSKSVGTAALVTVGHGNTIATTNAGNANSLSADRSFMSFGDNNGALGWTATGAPTDRIILGRKWLVQEYGAVGSVKVQVPDNNSALAMKLPAENTALYLLTDADGNFAAGATETAMVLNGTNWEADADLANGQYFTFGTKLIAPGGVVGAMIWLRADMDVVTNGSQQVSRWDNHGESALTTQTSGTASADITWADGTANFNPSLLYSGANSKMLQGALATAPTGVSSIFAAYRPNVLKDYGNPFSLGGGTGGAPGIATWAANPNISVDYNGGRCSSSGNVAVGIMGVADVIYTTSGTTTGATGAAFGLVATACGANTVATPDGTFQVGGRTWGTQPTRVLNGSLPEVIYYNSALSAAQRQRIQSYLSARYGTTLDQTTAQSYIASDGTTKMWDHSATNAVTYNKNITVIGRDDVSGLMQKQSKGSNAEGLVTIGNGNTVATTNAGNSNSFSADLSFMSFGDNNGARTWTTTGAPSNRSILARKWLVQEYGAIGSVRVQVPDNSSAAATRLAPENTTIYMLIDADGDFSAGATETAMTLNGTNWELDVDLANGQYFTFATLPLPYPGGDPTSLALWNKADADLSTSGSNITGWSDQTGTNTFAVTGTPQKIDAGMNFNPVVRFDGASRFTGNTNINNCTEFYAVGKVMNPSGGGGAGALIGNTAIASTNYVFTASSGTLYASGINGSSQYMGTNALGNSPGPALFVTDFSETPGANQRLMMNGLAYANTAGGDPAPYSQVPTLGSRVTENLLVNSELAEVIIYTGSRAGTPRTKIISYLAAKYGITLDQSTPQSYVASDGTTKMWDHTATNAATYNQNITVIGRDDASGLYQKQSRSINAAAMVTVGNGNTIATTNVGNANTFSADRSFMSFGDNNGTLAWTSTGAPAGRIITGRKWLVQEYGTVGSVKVQVPDNSSSLATKLPQEQTTVYLLTDADGNFSAGATETAMTLNGTNWEADVDLANGQYFIIATKFMAPGAELNNMLLWTKADDRLSTSGSNVTGWLDQTGTNTFAVTGTPQKIDAGMNYNPVVRFDGASRFTGNTALSACTEFYAVGKIVNPTGTSVSGALIGNSAVTHTNFAFHTDNGILYSSAPDGGGGAAYMGNNTLGSSPGPALFALDFTETPAATQRMMVNGLAYANTSGGDPLPSTFIPALGAKATENILANSELAEVIIYTGSRAGTPRTKIISYLAAKYGITLDQSTPQSYVASDGNTKIWDHTATNASTYNKNITVIGRDDLSGLDQKQSKAQTATGMVAISLGSTIEASNSANSNSFANDRSFVAFGDNGGAPNSVFADPACFHQLPGGIATRIQRVWMAQVTNFAESSTVTFDASALAGYLPVSNLRLLMDEDGVDWSNATVISGGESAAGYVVFSSVSLSNTRPYFTLASTNYGSTPLPVELVSFTGRTEDSRNVLQWITDSEHNDDHFEVQRSSNAVDFTSIGSVPGAGNSQVQLHYRFVDGAPLRGINYYRLRQVDYDGSAEFSNVVALQGPMDCLMRTLDPEGLFELLCPDASGSMELMNIMGQSLAVILTHEGQPLQIDLRSWPPGIYLLRSAANGKGSYSRLLRP